MATVLSCTYRAITKRKRRWDPQDLKPTAQAAEALHLFPGSLYSWRPVQSTLQLTKTTCSSLEAVTARVQGKLILMEFLEKYPRKEKKTPPNKQKVPESFFFPWEIYLIWTTETCSSRKMLQIVVVMIISRNQHHHLFLPLVLSYDGIRGGGAGKTLLYFMPSAYHFKTPKPQLMPSVLYLSNFNSDFSSSSLPACLKLPPVQSSLLLQFWHN